MKTDEFFSSDKRQSSPVRTISGIFMSLVLTALVLFIPIGSVRSQYPRTLPGNDSQQLKSGGKKSIPSGCTVITISRGDKVFFGGNDDYINPDSYYWVDPGDSTSYGVIWTGTPDNVQQGINEKGLAYDANGLPRARVNPHSERPAPEGGYTSYPVHLLHECVTVKEVIKWVETHRWHSYMIDQMHFADASGDAVVISAGKDGELVFTLKQQGDGFLVSTNFNVANPSNGFGYPDWRYDKSHELLGKLMKSDSNLTIADLTKGNGCGTPGKEQLDDRNDGGRPR